MSRSAAQRAPMRTTPSGATSASPERVEINQLLANLAVKPGDDGITTFKFDSWPAPGGLYSGDARYLRELPDDRLGWWSCTIQGARSVADVEQHIVRVLRAIAEAR